MDLKKISFLKLNYFFPNFPKHNFSKNKQNPHLYELRWYGEWLRGQISLTPIYKTSIKGFSAKFYNVIMLTSDTKLVLRLFSLVKHRSTACNVSPGQLWLLNYS